MEFESQRVHSQQKKIEKRLQRKKQRRHRSSKMSAGEQQMYSIERMKRSGQGKSCASAASQSVRKSGSDEKLHGKLQLQSTSAKRSISVEPSTRLRRPCGRSGWRGVRSDRP